MKLPAGTLYDAETVERFRAIQRRFHDQGLKYMKQECLAILADLEFLDKLSRPTEDKRP